MTLKTAVSTHLILDPQDLAWYMSDVHFQLPKEQSFFSKQDHFEYSQIAVQHDSLKEKDEEALVTMDYWQVDSLKRRLVRHHREHRKAFHDMEQAKPPIPEDQLEDMRETHVEYKTGKKELKKDNWREKRKREDRTLAGIWKGRTIYKIKKDYEIPEETKKTDIDKVFLRRGDIDDEMFPDVSSGPASSSKGEEKVRPSPEDLGAQKREEKSVQKKVSGPRLFGKQKASRDSKSAHPSPDPLESEDLFSIPVEEYEKRRDSEVKEAEPGSEPLEPRRISVPLPGSEVQDMTPAFKKILKKLEDKVELYKLHVKHYHMSPTQLKRRTSMLGLPDSVYEKCESVVNNCRVCSTSVAPPPRTRISGIRASNFGDVIFVDHAEIQLRKNKYIVLLILDGATNLLWATAQNSMNNKDTIQCLRMWTDDNNCMPKAIVGDEAFFQDDFLTYYRTHGIKECPCGARTPWPNRAEAAVRLLKRQWEYMTKSLEDDRFKGITVREAVKKTVWARNTQLTISGYSPLEIATGRRPPDLLDIEISDPAQLSVDPLPEDRTQQELQRIALRAHQEARQAMTWQEELCHQTVHTNQVKRYLYGCHLPMQIPLLLRR